MPVKKENIDIKKKYVVVKKKYRFRYFRYFRYFRILARLNCVPLQLGLRSGTRSGSLWHLLSIQIDIQMGK